MKKRRITILLFLIVTLGIGADSWADIKLQSAQNGERHAREELDRAYSLARSLDYDGWDGDESTSFFERKLDELKRVKDQVDDALGRYRSAKGD